MSARCFAAIGLHNPKTPENVGGALRAVGCYGASLLVVGGQRWQNQPKSKRLGKTDTQHAARHTPVIFTPDLMDCVPHGAALVSVEMSDNAISLPEFVHPESAFYVFGPEDGCVPFEILRASQRVIIPTRYCMNLAATVNVVLYDRIAKQTPTLPNDQFNDMGGG